MDRQIIYTGEIPLSADILNMEQEAMIALGFLAAATIGSGAWCDGLACNPTIPASMNVVVASGSIFVTTTIEQSAFSGLPSNAAPLVKCGINTLPTTFALTAPTTSGFSQNYLIEAQFQESDTTLTVLPYYNAANPTVPYLGQANSGVAQPTQRIQRVSLQLKAGAAAAAGAQFTPSVDGGWVGLWVITVNAGATTVTSSNIVMFAGAPFIQFKLPALFPPPARGLSANATYFVSSIGSDTLGNGTSASPWATLSHAWTTIVSTVNANGFPITIKLADGSYGGQVLFGAVPGNPSSVSIVGNVASPANVAIIGINAPGLLATFCGSVGIGGMIFSSSGTPGPYNDAGMGVVVSLGILYLTSPIVFAVCAYAHITAGLGGQFATEGVNYSITGNSIQHWVAENNGVIETVNSVITISGVPNFASAFCTATFNAQVANYSTTFVGTATGPRYVAAACGTIDTNGGGASYLPGNSAGSVFTGGQYI